MQKTGAAPSRRPGIPHERKTVILDRYIAREILIPQVGVFSVLGVIYSGFGAVRLLNDVVNGLLPAKTVAILVFLKLLIAFEVIFPVTFFLSIILALGRLHAENEVTALEACGIGRGRITCSVILLSVPLSAGRPPVLLCPPLGV